MANIPAVFGRKLYPGESMVVNDKDYIMVAGSFETNGTSAVTNVKGLGFGVNRTGVGVFDITVKPCIGRGLAAIAVGYQADTADTLDAGDVQVGTYTKSTGVLEIFTRSAAGNTAIDAPAYRTAQTVTSDAHTAAEAGYIVGPILGDAVVITKVLQSGVPAATQCTVTYAAGVPTLTFAAADAYTTCAYLLVPTAGTGVGALTDFNGPRVNFVALFHRNDTEDTAFTA